jgi:hypothetical protein
MILEGCSEEKIDKRNSSELLIGQWNSYEMGTQSTGFAQVITTSLTIAYESGISFSTDGTFKNRYHNSGLWTESTGEVTLSLRIRPFLWYILQELRTNQNLGLAVGKIR